MGAVAMAVAAAGYERDDYFVSQARAWREAKAAAMDHPNNDLDMAGRSAMSWRGARGGQGRHHRAATV